MPKFAVIGAGNGGMAMAAHLALKGHEVNLFNRTSDKLIPIQAQGGIYLEGLVEGYGPLKAITSDMSQAIKGVDIIMITVPAVGHRDVAQMCAPYLQDGQIIILNPGRTGGALEFSQTLYEYGTRALVTVAEASTFIYACRKTGQCSARIFDMKKSVSIAALPSIRTGMVLDALKEVYPQFVAAESVLETSLNNIGAIFHPAPTLLNAARIETTGGAFEYYIEGISPSIAKVIQRMDDERVAVANMLNVKCMSALEWMKVSYGVEADDLYSAIQQNKGYRGIMAPATTNTRYIFEDVPYSLVPISAFGRMAGVATPTIDAIIDLACTMSGVDYRAYGRTISKLGIDDMSMYEIYNYVYFGEIRRGVVA
ncbi:MAG: opine dehydrogenase [Clostridiales bacterium]|nr:opine dehydrogenase [Clostridiales bacterium]